MTFIKNLVFKNSLSKYAVAPGQILEEILEVKGISKVELAGRTGLSPKTISLIIAGKAPVTPETSIQFERVLGMAASIWNNLESSYRLFNAKEQDREEPVKFEAWYILTLIGVRNAKA